MKGRKTKTQIEYEQIITKVRANIIEIMDQEEAEGEYEEIVDAAKKLYGDFVLASYEIWHDGGVKAQYIPNSRVHARITKYGWDMGDWERFHEIYAYKTGIKSNLNFTLHRSRPEAGGFNLCANVIILPIKVRTKNTKETEAVFTEAKKYLKLVLADLLDLRKELKTAFKCPLFPPIKKKKMPKKLKVELKEIKRQIKQYKCASIGYSPREDESEYYVIVPMKDAEELAKDDKGEFANVKHEYGFEFLIYDDQFDLETEPVYIDTDLKLAWQFRGICD
jgi:hypothetical protein